MISPAIRTENIKKLRELLRGIPVGMLTMIDEPTGRMQPRPVAVQRQPFDGTLWFFVQFAGASQTDDPQKQHVVATFSNEDKKLYISVSGLASVVHDLNMKEEQWFNGLTSWFPKGLDDPDLTLLKVEVEHAEYWDGPDNAVARLVGFVRAFAAREPYNGNENEHLELM